MTVLHKILVFSENPAALPELCSGARQLGQEVIAVVIGSKSDAELAVQSGAKTYWLGEKAPSALLEDYTEAIARIAGEEKPNLMLIKASKRGKLIAGRLSVILHAGTVADALEIQAVSPTEVLIRHMVYGGAAIRTESPQTDSVIALVGSGIFTAEECPRSGELLAWEPALPESKIKLRETRPREGEKVDLGAAKRVVGIGRGIARQEDIAMVEELAKTIGAEIACSRPIAEGENWLARSRYLGVSGAIIKPDVYVAVGISGQIQHLVGVNAAKTIIAINKDQNAPIFQHADYGIVGDLYKVVPELVRLSSK